MLKLREVQEIMRNNGFSSMASMLVHDNKFLGMTVWTTNDIKDALRNEDIKPTKEMVEKVAEELSLDALEDCEPGWNHIDEVVRDMINDEELK
jgi:hypothetical protein